MNDLDIKQNRERSTRFRNKLKSQNDIHGWFSSVEDNEEVEICLFNETVIIDDLQLIEVLSKNRYYYKDSLYVLKMFPSNSFYKKTLKNNSSQPYKMYVKGINEWIKENCISHEEDAKHLFYTMRMKFEL